MIAPLKTDETNRIETACDVESDSRGCGLEAAKLEAIAFPLHLLRENSSRVIAYQKSASYKIVPPLGTCISTDMSYPKSPFAAFQGSG
jgi:hypothetical protein